MPRTELKVGFDKQAAALEAKAAGAASAKALETALKGGSTRASKDFQDIFGKGLTSQLGTAKVRGLFERSFSELAKDNRIKQSMGKIATTLARELGAGIKSKDVQRAFEQVSQQAEKEQDLRRRERRETIGTLRGGMMGSAGYDAATGRYRPGRLGVAMGGHAFQSAYGLGMGLLPGGGMGLGGMPGNIQRYGAAGGLAMTGVDMASSLLGSAIGYGREEESAALRMAPLMGKGQTGGSRGQVRGLIRGGMSREGGLFDAAETERMMMPLLRGGAEAGIGGVRKAERGFGMGGDLTQLLTAQAFRGGTVTQQSSKEELRKIIASGMQTGLERGRWGEIARGMADMIRSRGLGMTVATKEVALGLGRLGPQFKGEQGFEALRGMEALTKGGTTPMGQALSLMASGLGTPRGTLAASGVEGVGGDIFAARRQRELGMFGRRKHTGYQLLGEGAPQLSEWEGGERKGMGAGGFDAIIAGMKQSLGFTPGMRVGKEVRAGKGMTETEAEGLEAQRGAAVEMLATEMGISASATEELLDAWEGGNKNMEALKKIVEAGKPLEERAFQAIVDMADFKGVEQAFGRVMVKLFEDIAPILSQILAVLTQILDIASSTTARDKQEQRAGQTIVAPENRKFRELSIARLKKLEEQETSASGKVEFAQQRAMLEAAAAGVSPEEIIQDPKAALKRAGVSNELRLPGGAIAKIFSPGMKKEELVEAKVQAAENLRLQKILSAQTPANHLKIYNNVTANISKEDASVDTETKVTERKRAQGGGVGGSDVQTRDAPAIPQQDQIRTASTKVH